MLKFSGSFPRLWN